MLVHNLKSNTSYKQKLCASQMQVIVLAPHSLKSGKLVVVELVLVGRRKAIVQRLQIKDHYTRATTIINDEDHDLRRQTIKHTNEHES
jgi:hypothetical protein